MVQHDALPKAIVPPYLRSYQSPGIYFIVGVWAVWMLIFSAPALGMDHQEAATNCDLHRNVCVQTLQNHPITLSAEPKPVEAMRDLTFTVTFPDEMAPLKEAPYILLDMPGMHMGINRVDLKPATPGKYEGQGVIVRCKSGKRVWRATVMIPDLGKAQFVFDVIY